MPSIFRTAAILAFAALAAAQNGTLPTAASPIGGWRYDGCYAVADGTAGQLLASSPFMTPQFCTATCGAYAFARVQGNNCYCADSTQGLTLVPDAQCNLRCGGNPALACGRLPGQPFKRQIAGGTVSVYARLSIIPIGQIYISIITHVYVDICFNCIGGLQTITYCSTATLTGCGCAYQTTPTIPTTTTITAIGCNTCPGAVRTVTVTYPALVTPGTVVAGVVTVTAPVTTVVACASCPGGSTTSTVAQCPGCAIVTPAAPTPTRPVFVGSGENVKVGGGLLAAGALAVAALL